jgi:hypothetical protein
MNNFPDSINIKNKHALNEVFYDTNLNYLRKDIFEFIIKGNENDYFDLDIWCRKNINNNWNMMKRLKNVIVSELQQIGWNCKCSFGDTCLFIYSTENPPSSCYEDDFIN